MTLQAEVLGTRRDISIDERVELVLDLTRRIELLDRLMERARQQRLASDRRVGLPDAIRVELDALSLQERSKRL